MKKILSIILVGVMCLGLIACGSNVKDNTDESSKVDDSEIKEVQSVEITLDNWQDYFEIIEEEVPQTNAFGDVEDIHIAHYLVLKEGYLLSTEEITNIDIEYTYDTEKRWYQLDAETGEINWGDVESYETGQSEVQSVSSDTIYPFHLEGGYSSGSSGDMNFIVVRINLEVTRIQGTLYYEQ